MSIATYWSIAKGIAKNENIAIYKIIAKIIAILSKYCNTYCKISKVSQNYKSIAILTAKSQRITISVENIQKCCNTFAILLVHLLLIVGLMSFKSLFKFYIFTSCL